MGKAWEVFISDLIEIGYGIKLTDLSTPIGLCLWALIIFLPVRQFDTRDIWSGLTYIIFTAAAGVTLIVALPEQYTEAMEINSQIFLTLFMFVVAAVRWFVKIESYKNVDKDFDKVLEEKGEEYARRSERASESNQRRAG